jgi:RimJ/RimL family protein N-acetyltransferase
MVDKNHQSKGIGTKAFTLLLDYLASKQKYKRVTLNFVKGNQKAENFYTKFGFKRNGNMFNNEIVMEKYL